jgi:hypothetical protein
MKILVHMGMGKTGTSSLQQSLSTASENLRDKGVFYPRFRPQDVAHHLLVALCGDPNRIPPLNLREVGGPEAAVAQAKAAWEAVRREVEARRPEVLVFSSEHLILSTDRDDKANLVSYLSELSDDIVPIVYVRHPVHDFRSNVQQRLKSSNRPFLPHGIRIKNAVLDTEAEFPSPIQLVAFDRQVLQGGDIISDFAGRFLSPLVDPAELPAVRSNVGQSAEALVLMARLREELGDADGRGFKVVINPQIRKLDRDDPTTQPLTLLPEVEEAVLRAAVSHRWLAETDRLQIPDLDIKKIDGAVLPDWIREAAPHTLFKHDPIRLDRMRLAYEALERKQSADRESGKKMQTPDSRSNLNRGDKPLKTIERQLEPSRDHNSIASHASVVTEQNIVMLRLQTPEEPSSTPKKCMARLEVIRPFLPTGSVGAELGVFKGSFIEYLLSTKPTKLYSVDPWYRATPSWVWAKGEKSTLKAIKRILDAFSDEIETGTLVPLVEFSGTFLATLPDDSLDWVYIDTTHSYKQTKLELELSCQKVKRSGFIIGDDYFSDPSHKHHGVWKAVQEFVNSGRLELVVDGKASQFVAQRT